MSRIDTTLGALKAQNRKALIPFVTAGFPYADITPDLMHGMAEAGADVIELGVPFSDPSADGPVIQRSAAQLATIRLSGSDDCIPNLRQVLDQMAGNVPLLIEVKSRAETRVPALCLAVRRVLEGYQGQHAVMSFDPRVPKWFKIYAPLTVRGLVITEEEARGWKGNLRRHRDLWQAKPDFLAYDIRDLPSGFAAAQRARGRLLADARELPELGVGARRPLPEHVVFKTLHSLQRLIRKLFKAHVPQGKAKLVNGLFDHHCCGLACSVARIRFDADQLGRCTSVGGLQRGESDAVEAGDFAQIVACLHSIRVATIR